VRDCDVQIGSVSTLACGWNKLTRHEAILTTSELRRLIARLILKPVLTTSAI